MKYFEHTHRSLVKTITYRLLIIVSTLVISFLLTRNIEIAFNLTLVTSIANTLLYYVHERCWNDVTWGKVRK